jgi:hypothetical protein
MIFTIRSKAVRGGSVIPVLHSLMSAWEHRKAVRAASSLPRIFTKSSSTRVLIVLWSMGPYRQHYDRDTLPAISAYFLVAH